jgi:hypothetical protein
MRNRVTTFGFGRPSCIDFIKFDVVTDELGLCQKGEASKRGIMSEDNCLSRFDAEKPALKISRLNPFIVLLKAREVLRRAINVNF